ncbi:unnamed protein product [Oikopleura dioica]|uniref:SHSP domain-containing protein n=1 Tax=Oikopleura dioica TaxID=34765 RepID=E4Y221_OIKDI|nr:unnamed protein product [Oikopleura dioica]
MKITGFPFSNDFEQSFHRNHRRHPYFVSKFANAANSKNGCSSTSQKSSEWCSCLNLSSIPTKAEELHVKVDEKSQTLTVSGKSETESTRRDGVKIFSTHVWTKEIRIPDDVELKTIASKLHENKLTFVAERVQKEEDKHLEIPIEIVDTPALD